MSDEWLARVIEELDAINIKLIDLAEYLLIEPKLDPIQLALLRVQLHAMTAYQECLKQRIEAAK